MPAPLGTSRKESFCSIMKINGSRTVAAASFQILFISLMCNVRHWERCERAEYFAAGLHQPRHSWFQATLETMTIFWKNKSRLMTSPRCLCIPYTIVDFLNQSSWNLVCISWQLRQYQIHIYPSHYSAFDRFTWHKHTFTNRKQLGITKMYWLLGRKS
jgi:hypothetical protein